MCEALHETLKKHRLVKHTPCLQGTHKLLKIISIIILSVIVKRKKKSQTQSGLHKRFWTIAMSPKLKSWWLFWWDSFSASALGSPGRSLKPSWSQILHSLATEPAEELESNKVPQFPAKVPRLSSTSPSMNHLFKDMPCAGALGLYFLVIFDAEDGINLSLWSGMLNKLIASSSWEPVLSSWRCDKFHSKLWTRKFRICLGRGEGMKFCYYKTSSL